MREVRDLEYVRRGDQPLHLDLYLPDNAKAPVPVVMGVPGGGWRNCNKDGAKPWLVEHGFALASINYRVSSVATAPANLEDCRAAVAWLREHAAEYNLDAKRVGAWGSSAGGHLVALLGASPGDAAPVQAVCDLCGPTDLTRIDEVQHRIQFGTLYEVTAMFLGSPVNENLELARAMSPLHHVRPDNPPILIAHGACDAVVPVDESIVYYEELIKAGVDATLRIVPGAGHGIPDELVHDDVVEFFTRTLMK